MSKRVLPWKKVGEPTVLAAKFGKKLVSQVFEDPTGKTDDFVLFGQKDWSVVLPIVGGNKVVAVRQYKQGCDQVVVELPTGTADFKGETPKDVMCRELLEETGYKSLRVVSLGSPQFIATSSSWTRFHPFLALDCEKVQEIKLDTAEDIETIVFPINEWVALCLQEIVEPSAIVTTFRSLPYLGLLDRFNTYNPRPGCF